MVKGGKISPTKLAMSSASAKKIRDIEKKGAEAKANGATKKKEPVMIAKKAPAMAAVPDNEEEPVKYDQKKAEKVHYTHDEKHRMKYIRNKIRDGETLSEEEVAFAQNHKIELTKAKKKDGAAAEHHGKAHQKKDKKDSHPKGKDSHGHSNKKGDKSKKH